MGFSTSYTIERLEPRSLLGAHLVKDFAPGIGTSGPLGLTAEPAELNGWLYYWASGNSSGPSQMALCRTRGTPDQTQTVAVLSKPEGRWFPSLSVLHNRLYFLAYDVSHGTELWTSDGTPGGTFRATSSLPNQPTSLNLRITATNNLLFFAHYDTTGELRLYRSDGTDTGTFVVSPSTQVDAFQISRLGDRVVFYGTTGTTGSEPWSSDGTVQNTVMLGDFAPGSESSDSGGAALSSKPLAGVVNGRLCFYAAGQIYSTDGSPEGTIRLTNATLNQIEAYTSFVPFGDRLYFSLSASTWSTDGLTAQVAFANFAVIGYLSHSTPSTMFCYGYSNSNLSTYGVYTSDGTSTAPQLIKLVGPGSALYGEFPITACSNERFYFIAKDAAGGTEPWTSDGTTAGTLRVADIYSGTATSWPAKFTIFNGDLYFYATSETTGRDLWRADFTVPKVTQTSFNVDAAPLATISVAFDDDVSTSIFSNPVTLTNRDSGTSLPPGTLSFLSYDAFAHQAKFIFTSSIPADGNYRGKVANVSDYAGNSMVGETTFDFFFLQGDATRDRIVDTQDFNQLAGRFGQTGAVFSQGDFNYDQAVTSSDFNILVSQFGKRLAEPPAGASMPGIPAPSLFAVKNDEDAASEEIIV